MRRLITLQKAFRHIQRKIQNVEGQLSLLMKRSRRQGLTKNRRQKELLSREHTRKAKGTHAELFKGVPVKDEVIPLSEEQKHCGTAARKWRSSAGSLSARNSGSPLQRARSSTSTVRRRSARRAARPCHGKGGFVRQSPCAGGADPPQLCIGIRRGMDDVPEVRQFFAPVCRQEQDWKQTGVTLSRATLANWVLYCAGELFFPAV